MYLELRHLDGIEKVDLTFANYNFDSFDETKSYFLELLGAIAQYQDPFGLNILFKQFFSWIHDDLSTARNNQVLQALGLTSYDGLHDRYIKEVHQAMRVCAEDIHAVLKQGKKRDKTAHDVRTHIGRALNTHMECTLTLQNGLAARERTTPQMRRGIEKEPDGSSSYESIG